MELTSEQINCLRNIKTLLDSRRCHTDIEDILANFLSKLFEVKVEEVEIKFNPEDKVKITKRKYGHGFTIGEVVELVFNKSYGWIAMNENDQYLITEEEFEIYNNKVS